MKKGVLILLFAWLVGSLQSEAKMALVPQPVSVKKGSESWELRPNAKIAYTPEAARATAELMATQLRTATGYRLPVVSGESGDIILRLTTEKKSDRPDESYELSVKSNEVQICATAPAGLFYGTQTLRQLFSPTIYSTKSISTSWEAPCVQIKDKPRFVWRGLMLDCSRHFFTKEEIFSFLDNMAALKLNVFHWHLTDNQGWRIEIKKYPKLTTVGAWRDQTLKGRLPKKIEKRKYDGKRYGGFYTQEDIREIVAYAAARHITIVPEIDMPGHIQAAIAAYPEFGCTNLPVKVKTEWGFSLQLLSPEEKTIEFCQNILAEVMELFPSQYIHIGGDEARKDFWQKSPRIQKLMKERGLKNMDEMQAWFTAQINEYLNKNGRKLIGWDEICHGGLPQGAAVMWWHPNARQSVEQAAMDGHEIVVATYKYLYFDYYQSRNKKKEPLAIGGFLPLKQVYNFEPLSADWGKGASHVLGPQAQVWTEYIDSFSKVEYMTFPRACALAEIAWTPAEQKDFGTFLDRLKIQLERFDAAGVNYRLLDKPSSE